MPAVLPVKFSYSTHDLWFDPNEVDALEGDHVIVETERGIEIGLATKDPYEVSDYTFNEVIGEGNFAPVLRVATDEDLDLANELACRSEEVLPIFKRLARDSGLDIKPVGVEYLFGGGKAVCYFAALERVDFRQLVRDLSHELKVRVDMHQIGVREEAAFVGGYAHCGQELCCTRFGKKFEQISVRMAKEQDLPLNTSKISGACGRLMCCLRYEFDAYKDFKSRAPKSNAVIDTPLGKAKIVEYNTPKETISMRLENGKVITIPLAEMEASESACKKSKEQGCNCRPDTVPRSALDKLQSPDVQLALAELDRKFAEETGETFDIAAEAKQQEDDLFGTTKARKKRLDAAATERAYDAKDEEELKQLQNSASKKRRRKKKPQVDNSEPKPQRQEVEAKPQAPVEGHRRRRRRTADELGETLPPKYEAPKSSEDNHSDRKPRVRRRPGDHGGNAAAQSHASEAQPERQRRARRVRQDTVAQVPTERAVRTRRRHHKSQEDSSE